MILITTTHKPNFFIRICIFFEKILRWIIFSCLDLLDAARNNFRFLLNTAEILTLTLFVLTALHLLSIPLLNISIAALVMYHFRNFWSVFNVMQKHPGIQIIRFFTVFECIAHVTLLILILTSILSLSPSLTLELILGNASFLMVVMDLIRTSIVNVDLHQELGEKTKHPNIFIGRPNTRSPLEINESSMTLSIISGSLLLKICIILSVYSLVKPISFAVIFPLLFTSATLLISNWVNTFFFLPSIKWKLIRDPAGLGSCIEDCATPEREVLSVKHQDLRSDRHAQPMTFGSSDQSDRSCCGCFSWFNICNRDEKSAYNKVEMGSTEKDNTLGCS